MTGGWTDAQFTESGRWVRASLRASAGLEGEPPAPAPHPTPAPAPHPTPSTPGAGCCSWDGGRNCGTTTDFCKANKENCEGACNGQWIPA